MKAVTAVDYRLLSSFEEICAELRKPDCAERLGKPLGHWALPNDRRLPWAFLHRSVNELIDTPFEELSATPGIGQKKLRSLIDLLHRVARDEPERAEKEHSPPMPNSDESNGVFDADLVSESLWLKWREMARQSGLGGEKLGRLAPTLETLPTVIWHKTLEEFLDYSLQEIRDMKTYGEKRVRALLEVFYVAQRAAKALEGVPHLSLKLTPRFVTEIEEWLTQALASDEPPTADHIRVRLAEPLIEQIRIDLGEGIHELVVERIGLRSGPKSVRSQSQRLGVTRARVYQLFDECARVMAVRWPEGKSQMDRLGAQLERTGGDAEAVRLFQNVRNLVFPPKLEANGDE